MMRSVLAAIGWCMTLLAPASAQDAFPARRQVTVVVPFAAGGGSDLLGRILAEHLRKNLNQNVVVSNVVGAGGTVGTAQVARATPDGYTLLLHHIGMSTAPALYKDLSFDPVRSFEPIGLFADSPFMLISHKDFAPNNMREVVDYVKKHGDRVNFGTPGVGSGGHLCALLFEKEIGVKVTQLSYKGNFLALQDLLGGRLDLMCDSPPAAMGHIKSGAVKPYVMLGGRRLDALPNLPTATEAGYRTLDLMSIWYGVWAPAGTPKAVVERLSQALRAASYDAGVRAQVAKLDSTVFEPAEATPEALRQRLASQIQLWTPIIQSEPKQ